jgi:hypothetical protein
VVTDLISRHGQGCFSGSPEGSAGDHILLMADPVEAFAVEAAGPVWAVQELHEVRAAGDIAVIRQDWYRLAPGLADQAIAEGLWPSDGSKVNFVGAMAESLMGTRSALRRWGRTTLLLEQQNGHIDTGYLRRALADHYEGTRYEIDPLDGPSRVTPLCQHAGDGGALGTAVSCVAELSADPQQPIVWWVGLGSPCVSVYFPLLLEGDVPAAFDGEPSWLWQRTRQLREYLGLEPRRWMRVRETLSRLQERFDQELDEFLTQATHFRQRSATAELHRLASTLMQKHVQHFEETMQGLFEPQRRTPARMLLAEGGGD